jgi:hypothetical protein
MIMMIPHWSIDTKEVPVLFQEWKSSVNSLLSHAKIKNVWILTSTLHYTTMA